MKKHTVKRKFLRAVESFNKMAYTPPPGDPGAAGGMPPGAPMGGDPLAMLAALGGGGMMPPGGAPPGGAPPTAPAEQAPLPPPPADASAAAAAGPPPGESTGVNTTGIAQLQAAVAILKEGIKQLEKAVDAVGQGESAEPGAPPPEAAPPVEGEKTASTAEHALLDWLRMYANS